MNKETKKILEELGTEDSDKLELEELRRDKSIKENLEAELKILLSIFPELNAEAIPEEVFEACENGKGLAGQYALYYIKNQKEKEDIKNSNEKNSKSALPAITESKDETFYTPEMVSKMSAKDVRENYKSIIKSMEKWTNK